MEKYNFGNFYKKITGETEIPKSIKEIDKKFKILEIKKLGSNITPSNSVLEIQKYNINISEYLK